MALSKFIYLDPLIDTEEAVLAIRAAAMALMQEGKTTMSWVGEGTQASKAFVAPVMDILMETRNFLKQKNPQKYGFIATRSRVLFY